MEKPTLITKGGVGYGVDETQKVLATWIQPGASWVDPGGPLGFPR